MSWRSNTLVGLLVAANIPAGPAWSQNVGSEAPYLASFPHFNPDIGKDGPGDVGIGLQLELAKRGKFTQIQRELELYGWQLFLALNTADGSVRWEKWVSTDELQSLVPTSGPSSACAARQNTIVPLPSDRIQPRHLHIISPLKDVDVREVNAPLAAADRPVIDQNGNYVFFESLIDPSQVAYLCAHGLSTRRGQARFAAQGGRIDLPAGTETVDWSGAFSIKLAWKVLDPLRGDQPARFFHLPATILDLAENGKTIEREVEVGLVGMHLVHKSKSAPQRIWATFEHVDNLAVDTIANPGINASFYNPACPICAPNQPPASLADRTPVQIVRTVPIAPETEALNSEVQDVLRRRHSVWQFYKLVGVQWPTIPSARPATAADDPVTQLVNMSGGAPAPAFLSNVTMETYLQPSMGGSPPILRGPSCMSCHAGASATDALGQAGSAGSGDFSFYLSHHVR